jgi:hypothetical protein
MSAPELPDGWTFSPALGGAFVSQREDGGRYALTITLIGALLASQGLSIVNTPPTLDSVMDQMMRLARASGFVAHVKLTRPRRKKFAELARRKP